MTPIATRTTPLESRQAVRSQTVTPERFSMQTLTAEARKVMAEMDMDLSQNRLVRIIRRYINDGRADIDFRTWFIAYADPTGEKAVRNVMRSVR